MEPLDIPLDYLAVDLKEMAPSTQGNNYILVIVHILTRFVILKPLKQNSNSKWQKPS